MRAFMTVLFAALGSAGLGADVALMSLTGEWRGTGIIRSEPDKPQQEGRCRMNATPLVLGREVRLKGRCATQQGSSSLTMQFVLHEGGVIAGAVASPSLPETLQFIGRVEGSVTRLKTRENVDLDGTSGIVDLSINSLDRDHFDLVEWFHPANGADPIELVRMNFAHKEEEG
ncbi:MAG: hypothetical protein GY945_12200 [Rhodobacteraceae bacterium]|nr:hypothetical protein [Paracoccaceae bacterium]